jgi:6-phospho-3-hexuloisomerase
MNSYTYANKAAEEIKHIVSMVSANELDVAAKHVLTAKAVFVAGTGRSLLMLKAFAMRLMHFGLIAHVVGETTTPAITADDTLLIASGSGETATMLVVAKKSIAARANLVAVTAGKESSLATIARHLVIIPASSKIGGDYESWQPSGNSFEQSLLLILDGLAMHVAKARGLNPGRTLPLHANLE